MIKRSNIRAFDILGEKVNVNEARTVIEKNTLTILFPKLMKYVMLHII